MSIEKIVWRFVLLMILLALGLTIFDASKTKEKKPRLCDPTKVHIPEKKCNMHQIIRDDNELQIE